MKISGADEYSGLSLQVQSTSDDATRIAVVECVISASRHPSLRFLLHPSENPLVMQFILLYAKDEHECLQMYADTKIIDGFDIDPCKCFGIKWKCPTWEIPCLLKSSNADDIIYMHVADEDVWSTEEHVLGWDCMWESGKQHGMELYTQVYHMCLNNEIPWASKHPAAYVQAYEPLLEIRHTTQRKNTEHHSMVSWDKMSV